MENNTKNQLGVAIIITLISTAGLVGFWIGQKTLKNDLLWEYLEKWCENEDNNCCNFCYGHALQQKSTDDYFVFET